MQNTGFVEGASRFRIETAARQLRFCQNEDITSLAFDLGFSSSQNFTSTRSEFRRFQTEEVGQSDRDFATC